MDDRQVVAAIVRGDPNGLAEAYQEYASALHTYCRWLVRDADDAADAVHNTFIVARERLAQLRDPTKLKPWLYAVARRECLALRRRAAPLPLDFDAPAEVTEPGRAINADQVHSLVTLAIAGLSEGDREVLMLALRHDLSVTEVADSLGLSEGHARARLSRARKQLRRSLGALVVARVGRPGCDTLTSLLDEWAGDWTPLWVKRISRHLAECATCTACEREHCDADRLLAAFAALPLLAAGASMWDRLQLTCADASASAAIAQQAGRFDRAGFPEGGRPRRVGTGVAAGIVALLLGIGITVVAVAPGSPLSPATSGAAASSGSPGTGSGGPSGTAGPTVSGSAGPTPGGTAGATGSASGGGRGLNPDLTLVTRIQAICTAPKFRIEVEARGVETSLTSATLHFGRSGSAAMTIAGGRATVILTGLTAPSIIWSVVADGANGGHAASLLATVHNPC